VSAQREAAHTKNAKQHSTAGRIDFRDDRINPTKYLTPPSSPSFAIRAIRFAASVELARSWSNLPSWFNLPSEMTGARSMGLEEIRNKITVGEFGNDPNFKEYKTKLLGEVTKGTNAVPFLWPSASSPYSFEA
jgi:hypothetical protein